MSKKDSNVDFKFSDLTDFNVEKLLERRTLLKKELFNLRFQKTLNELTNTSQFLKVKRAIAKVNTELTQRKNNGVK